MYGMFDLLKEHWVCQSLGGMSPFRRLPGDGPVLA